MRTTRPATGRVSSGIPFFLLGALICLAGCASDLQQRFQAHIDYLASDELEGRGVGSPGIELAADYIARQFEQVGLEPGGEDGTYLQSFALTLHKTLMEATRLAFQGDPSERRLHRDFIPFHFSSDEAFEGDLVFCGYGIVSTRKKHDDFAGVDVRGKVVLMFRGEPPSWSKENAGATRHTMFRNKVYNAKDHGAVAVLIVNQTPMEGQADRLVEFEGRSSDSYGVPAFHITRAMVQDELQRAGLDSLRELQTRMDQGLIVSTRLVGLHVSGQAVFKKNRTSTKNVLGLLHGRGPRADEWVVIGAHYDHLGIRKPMMRKFKKGRLVTDSIAPQIHNGADDNASGTSGLIEIARLFTSSAHRPDRSLLFVAFTAEESGLLGSQYYIEHPVVPLEQTVAMLNLDMIGRMKPGSDTVQIFGVDCGSGFEPIVQQAATAVGLHTAPSPDTGGRSDHAVFVRKNIPSMHFFSGNHPDYHRPTDDSDKINAKDGARITVLVYRIAKELATRGERPAFVTVKHKKQVASGDLPSYRVVMGISPGYGDDGKPGMAVEAVSPEGPADLAGMKAGDRIIRVSGKKVANIYDYMAATRDNNPGDSVDVVVLRNGTELTLRVTLASTR